MAHKYHGKNSKTPRQTFVDTTAKVCERHVARKWKWNLSGSPVPVLRQKHKMAERDAHEEEAAIRDYFSKLKDLDMTTYLHY